MSTEVDEKQVATKSAWKRASKHVVRCPSGVYVGIRIPDLPALIEAGTIPQNLLDAAIGVATGSDERPTVELIKQQKEFTDLLVKITAVDPELSDEDLAEVPYEDKEFLVSIATRNRDFDAEGEHIGGLMRSENFRRFRRVGEFQSPLADL